MWSIEPEFWREHKQLLVYSGWERGFFIKQQNDLLYEGTFYCTKEPPDIRTARLDVTQVKQCESWSDAVRSIMTRCDFRQPFPISRSSWMHMNRELTDWLDAYRGGNPFMLNMRACLGRNGELSAKSKAMVVAAMNKGVGRRQ
jgi:hypothetical protein